MGVGIVHSFVHVTIIIVCGVFKGRPFHVHKNINIIYKAYLLHAHQQNVIEFEDKKKFLPNLIPALNKFYYFTIHIILLFYQYIIDS